MERELEVRLAELAGSLLEAEDLLRAYGDKWVSERLARLRDRLAAGDFSAVASALSEATGSMGSLRDRVLTPTNGDDIAETDVERVNARLVALVETIRSRALAAQAAGAPSGW